MFYQAQLASLKHTVIDEQSFFVSQHKRNDTIKNTKEYRQTTCVPEPFPLQMWQTFLKRKDLTDMKKDRSQQGEMFIKHLENNLLSW